MAITSQHSKHLSTEQTPPMVDTRRYLMRKMLAMVAGVVTAVMLWTSPVSCGELAPVYFEGILPPYSGFDPLLTPGGMAGSVALWTGIGLIGGDSAVRGVALTTPSLNPIIQQNTQFWNQVFAQRMTNPAISAAIQLGARRQAALEAHLLRPIPGPFFPVSVNPSRVPMSGGFGMCGVSICS
jgi:hypothetical protein